MSGLSETQVEQLVEWREGGKTHRWIADRLGITSSGVYYHCLRAGIPPKTVTNAVRNGFSADEDVRLNDLRIKGWSIKRIAAELGRPASSVFMRLNILAARDALEPRP